MHCTSSTAQPNLGYHKLRFTVLYARAGYASFSVVYFVCNRSIPVSLLCLLVFCTLICNRHMTISVVKAQTTAMIVPSAQVWLCLLPIPSSLNPVILNHQKVRSATTSNTSSSVRKPDFFHLIASSPNFLKFSGAKSFCHIISIWLHRAKFEFLQNLLSLNLYHSKKSSNLANLNGFLIKTFSLIAVKPPH